MPPPARLLLAAEVSEEEEEDVEEDDLDEEADWLLLTPARSPAPPAAEGPAFPPLPLPAALLPPFFLLLCQRTGWQLWAGKGEAQGEAEERSEEAGLKPACLSLFKLPLVEGQGVEIM